ncbi:MAG: DUF488 family protein [Terriglobales bacterium]
MTIYTVGHSTNTFEQLVSLLKRHDITAVADVRSQPYSRLNPQFNKKPFKAALKQCGMSYVFLGAELGARSTDPNCYVSGKVQYDLLAKTPVFQSGLERLQKGVTKFRVAMMCAEREPLICHRTILIARHLHVRGFAVHHILQNGNLEDHDSAMDRLVKLLRIPDQDMFRSKAEIIGLAYEMQGQKIAYGADEMEQTA